MAEKFDKSGLRYSFEKLRGKEKWQVRINGQFIAYTGVKSSKYVDEYLSEIGYKSRQEVYDECLSATMQSLRESQEAFENFLN
jgi:hypothetical protein